MLTIFLDLLETSLLKNKLCYTTRPALHSAASRRALNLLLEPNWRKFVRCPQSGPYFHDDLPFEHLLGDRDDNVGRRLYVLTSHEAACSLIKILIAFNPKLLRWWAESSASVFRPVQNPDPGDGNHGQRAIRITESLIIIDSGTTKKCSPPRHKPSRFELETLENESLSTIPFPDTYDSIFHEPPQAFMLHDGRDE
ncbi:hypothetical protein BDZ45DRAFT_749881 [Acephala macrosclerotiorum]|nr:hypothetical protein BDZ45DRAFT_749881 [Acephala macrosclerotiorum]